MSYGDRSAQRWIGPSASAKSYAQRLPLSGTLVNRVPELLGPFCGLVRPGIVICRLRAATPHLCKEPRPSPPSPPPSFAPSPVPAEPSPGCSSASARPEASCAEAPSRCTKRRRRPAPTCWPASSARSAGRCWSRSRPPTWPNGPSPTSCTTWAKPTPTPAASRSSARATKRSARWRARRRRARACRCSPTWSRGRRRSSSRRSAAIRQYVMPPTLLRDLSLTLRPGDEPGWDALIERLYRLGYHRADVVCAAGEYAVRGGLLDVFPASAACAARVEFFGDAVESIRPFDLAVAAQRRQPRDADDRCRGRRFRATRPTARAWPPAPPASRTWSRRCAPSSPAAPTCPNRGSRLPTNTPRRSSTTWPPTRSSCSKSPR